jgi:Domain of unknown function (DUF4157)
VPGRTLELAKEQPAPTKTVEPEPPDKERPTGPGQPATEVATALPPPDGRPPAARGAALLAAPDLGAAHRARIMRAIQQRAGNAWVARQARPDLTVSHPASPAEREAENVADQVASGTAAASPIRAVGQGAAATHRQEAGPAPEPEGTAAAATAIQQRGAGQPVSPPARRSLERRMGVDLGDARVHTDAAAADAAAGLNARAFSHGRDIYLGRGESQGDDRLMAHELTHVVQHRSGTGADLARQAAAPPATPAAPGTAPTGDDVAPGVVELKGKPGFDPEGPTRDFLAGRKQATVNVKFGTLASGPIRVRVGRGGYTFEHQAIPLVHPLLAPLREAAPNLAPSLVLSFKKGALQGHVGIAAEGKLKSADRESVARHLQRAPEIVGLAGFKLDKLPELVNNIDGGELHLGLKGVAVKLGAAFSGLVTIEVVNERVAFEGAADVAVKGLATGSLKLTRSPAGLITGHVLVAVQLSKDLTGSVDVTWDGQAVTGEGKVGYKGEKLSGEVTLRLMEKGQAEALERERKAPPEEGSGPEAAPAAKASAKAAPKRRTGPVAYVLFGEGDLTFAFTDWLNGTAHVIVDPTGYVTIIGKITPQKEFPLFEPKEYVKDLFKLKASASYGLPVVGNIFVFGSVGLDTFAKLDGKLYNIVVEGTYSTDPKKNKDFRIQASLNISAAAGLRLRAEAGVGLEILDHDLKAGAGINGIAGIKAYAEATPVIGYREQGAAEAEDKKGEFYIRGDLEVAAQPFLGLSGDLFIELDAPWWSPLDDERWTWPLGEKEWPVGGTMGVLVSVDHVLGSKQFPTVEFKPVEFSPDKFMTDMYNDKAKAKSGEQGDKPAAWNEKNSPEAEPPKPGEGKGIPPTGKPAELDKAKAPAAPAAAGPARPADPHAKTAEGKSVAQLQEEAAKKGKKPAGPTPGPAGAAGVKSEAPAKQGTGEEAHQDRLRDGLAALDQVTQRYARDGATKDEVVTGVKSVRRKFSVFKSIEVVDGGDTWDYEYVASPGKKTGAKKKKPPTTPAPAIKPQADGKDLERIKAGQLLDLTDYMNPIGEQFPAKSLPPDYLSPKDSKQRTNRERAKKGLTGFLVNDDFVELHHTTQDFFSILNETSHTFHQSVVDDPDYHPFADDPGYLSWREWFGQYRGQIRRLGEIYNRIRQKYWRRRF